MALECALRSNVRTVWNRFSLAELKSTHTRSFWCSPTVNAAKENVVSDQRPTNKEAPEFRVYEIAGLKKEERKKMTRPAKPPVPPDRSLRLSPDHDWTSVWPTRSVFKSSVVPFPVRQGVIKSKEENEGVSPGRYANAELMKIPNFLHLTPAHIKAHCKAIKKFCTPWPKGLETDEKCEEHFPLEMKFSNYLSSGPSIRNSKARGVTYKIKLSRLGLDYHGEDKLRRLAGDRLNVDTGELTLHSDRCPLVKQNRDFALYLLTALYYESKKVESWEEEKTEADMEKYFWDISQSKKTVIRLLSKIKDSDNDQKSSDLSEELVQSKPVQEYKEAVSSLFNSGESYDNLNQYKQSVLNLLMVKK